MWLKIEFEVEIWGAKKKVELFQVPGGAGYWDLMIDRLFWGSFVDYNGRWELRLQIVRAERVKRGKTFKDIRSSPPWWFTMADMVILCEMIEERLPAESRPQSSYVHFSVHRSEGL